LKPKRNVMDQMCSLTKNKINKKEVVMSQP
jgi:hypothetical protein